MPKTRDRRVYIYMSDETGRRGDYIKSGNRRAIHEVDPKLRPSVLHREKHAEETRRREVEREMHRRKKRRLKSRRDLE